jgi:hypothetical protein
MHYTDTVSKNTDFRKEDSGEGRMVDTDLRLSATHLA